MSNNSYKHIMLGLIVVVLSLFLLMYAIPYGVILPEDNNISALSPDFWIKIIVWIMLAAGTCLLWKGIKLKSNKKNESPFKGMDNIAIEIKRGLASIAGLFLYYHTIKWLGIVLASIIFIMLFLIMIGERRWMISSSIAIILPVGLYYFFQNVTGTPMPLGIFQ